MIPQTTKPDAGTRLGSMLLDHFIMSVIASVVMIPAMIPIFTQAFNVSHDPADFDFIKIGFFAYAGAALYFCKDGFNGRSLAKRALNLQVVDQDSGHPASPYKCFIRNIFCIFWPVEVIATLINPARRIGDIIAGTRVERFNIENEHAKTNWIKVILSYILAFTLVFLLYLPIRMLVSNIKSEKVEYVQGSLNERESAELEQIFNDSLGQIMTADVRVYDEIVDEPDLKFVSVILRLKENYLEDDDEFEELKNVTTPLIYSKYDEEAIKGRVQYVYKESHNMRIRSIDLD